MPYSPDFLKDFPSNDNKSVPLSGLDFLLFSRRILPHTPEIGYYKRLTGL